MSQFDSEHATDSNGTRTTLIVLVVAIVAVVILFMLYSHLPRANSAAGTSSDLVTPTPQMTGSVGSITLNRVVNVEGVDITINQVQQASNFSDLQGQASPYTLRVYVQTRNAGQEPISVNFKPNARLLLPDGKAIAPTLITVSPLSLPKVTQVGYLDFPLQQSAPISGMVLRFDSKTSVPLTTK
jgi:hypothetical protein